MPAIFVSKRALATLTCYWSELIFMNYPEFSKLRISFFFLQKEKLSQYWVWSNLQREPGRGHLWEKPISSTMHSPLSPVTSKCPFYSHTMSKHIEDVVCNGIRWTEDGSIPLRLLLAMESKTDVPKQDDYTKEVEIAKVSKCPDGREMCKKQETGDWLETHTFPPHYLSGCLAKSPKLGSLLYK